MTANMTERFRGILRGARKHDASDVHLIADLPPAIRVGGEIIIASNLDPLSQEDLRGIVDELLTDQQKERLARERELCVSYFDIDGGRLRLSLYHRIGAPEMAIRLCNLDVKTADELMLPPAVNDFAERRSGLVIVTGPTGTGKTTTLNYMVDLINATRRCKIITIEDPVEYEHPHRRSIITQIEVGTDTNDFAHCLRHVLRLDPDVIAIGEMRDLETMETVLTAAETGHLVLATLHTPGASGSVERIVSSFEGSRQKQVTYQLANTLQGVVAQRLVPTIDKSRRVLATEVLVANEALRNLIREQKPQQIQNVITSGRASGMHSMEESLSGLYSRGQISLDQALANSENPEHLKALLKV
ncbi:MAG: type IV pilus twitching motility protein PilT [Planctomycetota bacterium]